MPGCTGDVLMSVRGKPWKLSVSVWAGEVGSPVSAPGGGMGWQVASWVTLPVGKGDRRGYGERLVQTARGQPAGARPASAIRQVQWASLCTQAAEATSSLAGTWPLRPSWSKSGMEAVRGEEEGEEGKAAFIDHFPHAGHVLGVLPIKSNSSRKKTVTGHFGARHYFK